MICKKSMVIANIVMFVCILFSCNQNNIEKKLLDNLSEKNQAKFQNVFDHYKKSKEDLKLQAAYFLVENMDGLGYYKGKQIDDYNVVFDILANKPLGYRESLPWYSNELVSMFDSLSMIYGYLNHKNFHFVDDYDAFTEESFIKYIDDTFEAWENPWSKPYVSFENFCNYILPYRNFTEPLEDWRPMFLDKYSWLKDSIDSNAKLIEVAQILNIDSELKYSNGFSRYTVSTAPSLLLKAKYGNCTESSNYKSMIMRSHGIPVAIDFVPIYGSDHNSHFWNSIMDENGNMISFEEALNDINAFVAYKYKISKVYRKTFKKNKEILELIESEGCIPGTFGSAKIKDVTSEYVATSNVKLRLKNRPDSVGFVYVGVFDNKSWKAIDYAKISNGDIAEFEDLGRDVLYLPFYYINNTIVPADIPFLITPKGYIKYLEPEKERQDIKLIRKYHMHKRKKNWLQCLKGGRFEGANTSDFSDAKILALINETPGEHFTELSSNTMKPFKYLRFVFSKDELKIGYDGDGASIAEIEFISNGGQLVKGTPFGTKGRPYNPYLAEKCFDGDKLTFFEDARNNFKDEKFIALKLNSPTIIKKIRFLPRNDLNSIQIGDTYELQYWNNNRFETIEKVIANDTILNFNSVPKNAVFLLRNLSGGSEERIFTYEKGKQVWW